LGIGLWTSGWGQQPDNSSHAADRAAAAARAAASELAPSLPEADSLARWSGLPVRGISFEGVAASRLAPLPGHLAQAEGAPLDPENMKKSLRQLYATGLYERSEERRVGKEC
jgi:outer membrane protein assembly factor BamA